MPDGFIPVYDSMDLYCVRFDLSGKYILMSDIDLTDDIAPGGDLELESRGWDPIGGEGRYTNLAFTGVFDGNGHTISGMWINIDETFTGTGTTCSGASTRTEKQLRIDRMYGNFDFENDWVMYPCSSYKYPQLRGNEQDTELTDHAFGEWTVTTAPHRDRAGY